MTQQKLVDEIPLHFPELLVIAKYVKIRFENRGSRNKIHEFMNSFIFSDLEVKRSKILQILNKRDYFYSHY